MSPTAPSRGDIAIQTHKPVLNSRTVSQAHTLSFTEVGSGLIGDLAPDFPDGVSSCEFVNHPHMSQTSARNLQSMSGYKNFFVSQCFPKLCVSEALDTRCKPMSRGFILQKCIEILYYRKAYVTSREQKQV